MLLPSNLAAFAACFGNRGTVSQTLAVISPIAKRYAFEDLAVRQIELNGREIRNALQTAIALAEFEILGSRSNDDNELVIVEEAHIRRVLKM
jgi:hypothetical protein